MARRPPQAPRPLGPEGLKVWNRIWRLDAAWIDTRTDMEHVLVLCESMDERASLRLVVLGDPDEWRTRNQLRTLDAQITDMIARLGLTPVDRKSLQVADAPKGRLAEIRALRTT